MDESQLWVQINMHPTNLSFQTVVSCHGGKWDVVVGNTTVRGTSRKTYPLPGDGFDEKYKVIENAMNQIVGHLRNIGYIALDLDMQWGYEGGYSGTHVSRSDLPFPSIHQSGVSSTYSDAIIERGQRVMKDIGSSRKNGLKPMLNYWRRAKELDDLGFDSEAFLNYFKVIECLAELNEDETIKQAILNRFCPGSEPQATLCKRYRARDRDAKKKLRGHIAFVAKAFSAAGISPQMRRGLFIATLDFVYMRNQWNVGHKFVRSNPNDRYGAIGEHSDEFSLVMIENLYISKITNLMILLYVRPGRYKLHSAGGMPMVVPTKGKGSIKDDDK